MVITTDRNDVVQKILEKAKRGTKIIFIPGNHDEVVETLLALQWVA